MLLVKTKVGPSKIHGLGFLANQFIPKGTPVWRFSPGLDLKFTEAEFQKLPELARQRIEHYYYKSLVDNTYILPFDDARFFNHSPNPNVVSIDLLDDPEGMDIASRDIQPGEELVCDCCDFDASCRDGKETYAKE